MSSKKLKIRAIGNSSGIVLPKEMLERMHVTRGDELCACEAPGGYFISTYDAEFARKMEVAEKVMRNRRDALRELAK